jgi:hypothetical protein
MSIKTGDTTNAPQINLNPAPEPRDATRTGGSPVTSSAGSPQAADSIALSNTNALVQQALSAGTDERTARVQELKQLYDNNQYYADPLTVSRSLISAHIAGE